MSQPPIPWPPKPLPDDILILVGKAITSFNMLELLIDAVIFLVFPVENFNFFRILTSRSNRLQILEDLLDPRINTPLEKYLKDWKRRFRQITDQRHRYAHSILTPVADSSRAEDIRRVKHRGPLDVDLAAQVLPKEELLSLIGNIENLSNDIANTLNSPELRHL